MPEELPDQRGRRWFRVDVDWPGENVRAAGPTGEAAFVRLLAISARLHLDGKVSATDALRAVYGLRKGREALVRLVDTGALSVAPDGSLIIPHYLEWQESRTQVEQRRRKARDRMRRVRSRERSREQGDVFAGTDLGVRANVEDVFAGTERARSRLDVDLELRPGTDLESALDTYPAAEEPTFTRTAEPGRSSEPESIGSIAAEIASGNVSLRDTDLGDLEPCFSPIQRHAYAKLVARDPAWLDVSPGQIGRLKTSENGAGDKALTETLLAISYEPPQLEASPAAYLDAVFTEKLAQVLAVQAAKPQPLEETGS